MLGGTARGGGVGGGGGSVIAPLPPLAPPQGSGYLQAASLSSLDLLLSLPPHPARTPEAAHPRSPEPPAPRTHPSLPGIESGPSGAAAPWRRAAVSKLSESGLRPPAPSAPQTRAARLAPSGERRGRRAAARGFPGLQRQQ